MKNSAATRLLALALGSALLVGLAGAQSAQPENRQPAPTAPRPDGDRPDARQEMPADPALAKKFLERRLEETTKREENIRTLLARLERGDSPAEVGKDLDPGRREMNRRGSDQGDQRGTRTDRGPDHQAPRAKITPEDRDHALQFLRDNSPMLATRFDKMIKSDAETADRILGHMMSRIREAEAAKEHSPGLFKLRLEEMEGGAALVDAMKAYREANAATPPDAAKVNAATEQLRSALARQLENRLSAQANEIESLAKRLSDLKADLAQKQSTRKETIDAMLVRFKDGKDLRERAPREDGPGRDGPGERRPDRPAPGPGTPGTPPGK